MFLHSGAVKTGEARKPQAFWLRLAEDEQNTNAHQLGRQKPNAQIGAGRTYRVREQRERGKMK